MRRLNQYLCAFALTFLVPTIALAGTSPAQDPDGQALKALEPLFDVLVQLFLTCLSI